MTPLARRLRGLVYRAFAATGTAPRVPALGGALDSNPARVRAALAELSAAHAVVLDAHGEVEWALPFSAVPTPYRVTDGRTVWHAPCAWDALAIGPLLGRATRVEARCPDCGQALRLDVSPTTATPLGPASSTAPVVHFARAARDWWLDIRATWRTIRLFRDEEHARRTRVAEGLGGEVVPMPRLAALARTWYAGRLEDAYAPPRPEDRQIQLAAHGFTGAFWELR